MDQTAIGDGPVGLPGGIASPMTSERQPLRVSRHLVLALAAALISPFTGLAWPVALLTGMVIGRDQVERAAGRVPAGTTAVRALAVTGGVFAAIILGAVIGGLIAFTIVALAALSERIAADSSPTDRSIARILLLVVTTIGWFAFLTVLDGRVDIRFGS